MDRESDPEKALPVSYQFRLPCTYIGKCLLSRDPLTRKLRDQESITQWYSLEIHGLTFLNYIEFVGRHILRINSCERFSQASSNSLLLVSSGKNGVERKKCRERKGIRKERKTIVALTAAPKVGVTNALHCTIDRLRL